MTDLLTLQSADGARADIHPQGAHLTQWWPAGSAESRLFLSERAVFAPGVPIRGGVPVIFPQFAGEGPLPKHGFARSRPWVLQDRSLSDSGTALARYALADDAETRALWPHAFLVTLTIELGGQTLTVTLDVHNTGATTFAFTAALHTYLAVQDLEDVGLHGLAGLHYRDTADAGHMKPEAMASLSFHGEVDRNYVATPETLRLQDGTRSLQIAQKGFADTVVWNPGAETSSKFKDLAPQDYRRFVCIEAAQIAHPVQLAPGAGWQGSQQLIAG